MSKMKALLAAAAIGCAIAFAPMQTADAANNKQEAAVAAPAAITVTADYMRYEDLTGNLMAVGNVVVSQGDKKISAQRVDGNSQSSDVRVDGRAVYEALGVKLEGGPIVYNWVQRKGSVQHMAGHVDKEQVHGESIELLPDRYVIHAGRVTRCQAEEPHYYLSADRIELIPGETLTAYNVRIVLMGNTLYSQAKYRKSLKEKAAGEATLIPRIGYDSDNGVMITQRLEYPLTERWSLYAEPAYHSKHGFVPFAGVKYEGEGYTARIVSGELWDGDGYKLQKDVEAQIAFDKKRIGHSPYHYTVAASYGKWDDDVKSSWHTEGKVYVSRDPLYLNHDKDMWLNLGAGTGYMHESYLSDGWATTAYDAVLHKRWQRWQANTGYHYNRENRNLFDYGRADLAENWETGVSYRASDKDSFGVIVRYDLQGNRIYDLDFVWKRNLTDCFQTELTYKQKQREIDFDIHLLNW